MLAEPKAVLWDFDGTLVDTEPIWDETQDGMLAERGLEFTAEHRALMRGSSSMVTAEIMAELEAVGAEAASRAATRGGEDRGCPSACAA